ncbi:MAG: TonB-dependent siderophore receptor, partial [Acinetobacter sp.]
MVSTTLVRRKSELKSLIPLLSISGFIFLTNSSFAASPSEIEESEKKVERLPTLTITATRADEVQEKSKQVTKLDEKQLELLKNASSGNIAT